MSFEFSGRTDPVAVFVDGDNLSHDHAGAILTLASSLGRVTLCRVYGNMTKAVAWDADPAFSSHHAAGGKNCADMHLTIDAMEHVLAGRARAVVIASNDGDFGPLAMRLRELGLQVQGIGGARASLAFEAACTQFHRIAPEMPLPVVRLDALDQLVQTIILTHGTAGKMPLALLGSKLGKTDKAAAHGAPKWRPILEARSEHYKLIGPLDQTLVCLRHP